MRTISILFVPFLLAVAGILPSAIVNANTDHDAVIRDLNAPEYVASVLENSEMSEEEEKTDFALLSEIMDYSVVLDRLQERIDSEETTPENRDRASRVYEDISRERKNCVKKLNKKLINLTTEELSNRILAYSK